MSKNEKVITVGEVREVTILVQTYEDLVFKLKELRDTGRVDAWSIVKVERSRDQLYRHLIELTHDLRKELLLPSA